MSKELKTLEILANLTKSVDGLKKNVDLSHARIDQRMGRLNSQQDRVKALEEKVSSLPLSFCESVKVDFRLLLSRGSYRDWLPFARSFNRDLVTARQSL